jgi:hypothetical protein
MMTFKQFLTEIHNEYIDFKIKVVGGPHRGDHFGYIPEVKIYDAHILDNTHVKLILNPLNDNHITIQNFNSYFFGPKDQLQEQALQALYNYDPKLIMTDKAKETFGDLVDEL